MAPQCSKCIKTICDGSRGANYFAMLQLQLGSQEPGGLCAKDVTSVPFHQFRRSISIGAISNRIQPWKPGSLRMLWDFGFQPQRTALRIYWNALKLLRGPARVGLPANLVQCSDPKTVLVQFP